MSEIPTNPYAIVEKLEKRVAELERLYESSKETNLDLLEAQMKHRQRIKELEAALVADMTQEAQQRGEYDDSN